jgi:peptidoglycan/LPS O-acetylase OafA/YrhL
LRGASIDRVYYGPDTHADALLVGCIFGCYFVRGRLPAFIASGRARKVSIAMSLMVVLAAAAMVGHVPSRLAYGTQITSTAFAFAAGVFVVCAALEGTAIAWALSARPVVFLGRISYSVYLWHLPLLVAFAGVDRHFGLRTLAAVLVTLVVAAGSRYMVELPFVARGRSVTPEPVRTAPVPVSA